MPAIGRLETGKADMSKTRRFGSQKPLERLGEAIGQHLHGGGWDMLTTTTLKPCGQIILGGERALLSILHLDDLQHLVIDHARRSQTVHEQMGLFLIHEKTIFKRSHHPNYN